MTTPLFPIDLPDLQWLEFEAEGFPRPVSGVIYRTGNPPCCGVPLGGISTGCIDIDARGVYGFSCSTAARFIPTESTAVYLGKRHSASRSSETAPDMNCPGYGLPDTGTNVDRQVS